MTEAQRRRQELLLQTRKLYSDKHKVPAVHPRYGGANLYSEAHEVSESSPQLNSFKLRLLISMLLLIIYAGADYTGTMIGDYSSEDIVNAVSTNVDVAQVWKSL